MASRVEAVVSPQEELDIVETEARILELAEPFGDVDPEELAQARAHRQELNGNANPYVPWSCPSVEFQCSCGALITADMPHSHDDDPASSRQELQQPEDLDDYETAEEDYGYEVACGYMFR